MLRRTISTVRPVGRTRYRRPKRPTIDPIRMAADLRAARVRQARAARAAELTVRDLALSWGISPSTIYRIVARNELRAVLRGGKLVFRAEDAQAYINARTFQGDQRIYPDEPLRQDG